MAERTRHSNMGRRTEQAKQALIRCIWTSKLEPGDKLPSTEIIQKELGFGKATIMRAILSLKNDGVLTVRPHVGTYLAKSDADGHHGWSVGVLHGIYSEGITPYHAYLGYTLQKCFASEGCRIVNFDSNMQLSTGSLPFSQRGIDCFPGLQRSVEENRLDAVIMTVNSKRIYNWLKKHGKYPCVIGSSELLPKGGRGVVLSRKDIIQEASDSLFQYGCKRLALVKSAGRNQSVPLSVFKRVVKNTVIDNPEDYFFTGRSIRGGHEIAKKILSMPIGKRPDGLVILDEYVAMGLSSYLVLAERKSGEKYMPQIACARTQQLGIELPFDDVIYFDLDINEITQYCVDIIMECLRKESVHEKSVYVKYHRVIS